MWKFIQWSVATIVAVFLLAMVVNQILTASTGRARDVSVAVLKEKLATLEAERTTPVLASNPPMPTQPEGETAAPEEADFSALRERWMGLRKEAEAAINECTFAPLVLAEIREAVADPENWSLEREEMEQIAAYQACLGEIIEKTLTLCADTARYVEVRGEISRAKVDELQSGFRDSSQMLRTHAQVMTAAGEHRVALSALSGFFDLAAFWTDYTIREGEYVGWIWAALHAALESGTVSNEQWDTLLRQLAAQKAPERFALKAERSSAKVLYDYEHFSESIARIDPARYPIRYARNWAYRNVSTPLFNHDVDVFSRATATLLELTRLPYFEAKPALEQFYEDFDVEPSPREIKFVRGNSAWMHVLRLSRDGFASEARRQANVDVARIAILLDRHRRAVGANPESLGVLAKAQSVPEFVNPLDGEPYFYELTGETFWLGYYDPTLSESADPAVADAKTIVYWGIPYGGFGVLLTDGTFLKPFVRGE